MSETIKDYLHLYLGCEVLIESENFKSKNKTDKIIDTLTGIGTDGWCVCKNYTLMADEGIKPILRQLSDMTEEEYNEYQKFADLVPYKDLMLNTFGEYQEVYGSDNTYNPQAFIWLLKNSFDVFALISKGFAIDAATILKQKQ